MKSRRALIVVACALVVLGCSDNGASDLQVEVQTSVFRSVGATHAVLSEAISTRMGTRSHFAFVTDTDERIAVLASDFHFAGDYLSASGTAMESDRSSFILKGDGSNLYGWVVLHDRNVAYEYTTSPDGRVLVEKVPVTKIFPVCDSDVDIATIDDEGVELGGPSLDLIDGPPHVGPYDGTSDTKKLQSKPGATKVLFMDVAPLPLAAAQLWRGWQIVAAAFSAFDVNVTTDAAVYDATPMRDRGKACSRPEPGRSSCGLNAFGTARCCNIFNKRNGYGQGATTTHELGHLMGLRHDGTTGGSAYYPGLASFRWCPIMGANNPKTSWGGQALFQWSKGEYANANNKQDDLEVISRNLPFRADDIPTSRPLMVKNGSQVAAADTFGQIARNTDSDTFTFAVAEGGGRATLTIDRIEDVGGGYLDVEAQIQNAEGMVLAKGNDLVARTAKLDDMLPAGQYELIIKGGAEGTPLAGFSNYSSLGFYGISGAITAAAAGGPDAGVDTGGMAGADPTPPDAGAGGPGAGEPGGNVTPDAGAAGAGPGEPAPGEPGTGGPPGASSPGPGAGGGAVGSPAATSSPPIDAGFGCSVADRSADVSAPGAGLLMVLVMSRFGRGRRRSVRKAMGQSAPGLPAAGPE
jgi:hypothetical protein